jgi:hypothetical protein
MDEFVELAEEMITRAESVECEVEDFHVGLIILYNAIRNRLEAEEVDPDDEDLQAMAS